MKRAIYTVVAIVAMLLSNFFAIGKLYAGSQSIYPYLKFVEIYHVSVNCYLHDYEDPIRKTTSLYLGATTDLTIRDTHDYCHGSTFNLGTTCEEDLQAYLDVISNTGNCEIQSDAWPNSAGIEALCRGNRNSVVNMIFDLCGVMMTSE
jgi:hypothetical protein